MARLSYLLFGLLGAACVSALEICPPPSSGDQVATLTWNITAPTDRQTPDLDYLVVNGKWPADALVYDRCTRLDLTVINSLPIGDDDDVTLHFHGLLQIQGQTIMDGVQGLSQSGITRGNKFTYHIRLEQEGTYWVHSHSAGQYPRGVRAPLIVQPRTADLAADYGQIRSESDALIALSDWWPNFKQAEHDSRTDHCSGDPNNKGIEVPPHRVTFNDQYGYYLPKNINDQTKQTEAIANAKAKRTITVACGTTKRIRLVNMSSHARFYIAFSDEREFEVNELDGIIYKPQKTKWLELSSGQRASILVNGKNGNSCSPAYIVAISDPKIIGSSKNCKVPATNSGYPEVQYTHGYLDVKDSSNQVRGSPEPGLTTLGNEPRLVPGEDFPASWITLTDKRLGIPYKKLYYSSTVNQDFGYVQGGSRDRTSFLGVGGAEDIGMEPQDKIPAWIPTYSKDVDDRSSHMHYIALGAVGGLPTMTENLNADRKAAAWENPDKYSTDANRKWPSLYRVLRDDFDDNTIQSASTYIEGDAQKARTIMILDDQPHWFIIRSDLGDHPLHMHGHHFQVLAKLPDQYWKQNYAETYALVADYNKRPESKANPNFPPRRDTLMIEKGITYVIAIKADNPGVWAFHCHNDMHAVAGMFAQIIERPKELRKMLGSWAQITNDQNQQEIRWWYSAYGLGNWKNEQKIGDWMVDGFQKAIQKYGLQNVFANNPMKPSKWGYNLKRTLFEEGEVVGIELAAVEIEVEVEPLALGREASRISICVVAIIVLHGVGFWLAFQTD